MYQPRQHPWHPFRGPGLCGLRGTTCFLITLTCIIVFPLLYCLRPTTPEPGNSTTTTSPTATSSQVIVPTLDKNPSLRRDERSVNQGHCVTTHGGITIDYVKGSHTVYNFDLCSVIRCRSNGAAWRGYNTYLCAFLWGRPTAIPWCNRWSEVLAYSGPYWDPPGIWVNKTNLVSHFKLYRISRGVGHNPLALIISGLWPNNTRSSGDCPGNDKSFYLTIGVDQAGYDSIGVVKVVVTEPKPIAKLVAAQGIGSAKITIVKVTKDAKLPDKATETRLDPQLSLALETGFDNDNMWLKWVRFTVGRGRRTDCVACARAKPALCTTPFRSDPREGNGTAFWCAVNLFGPNGARPEEECRITHETYPIVESKDFPQNVHAYPGNYTCISSTGSLNVSFLPDSYCGHIIQMSDALVKAPGLKNQMKARADIWWMCGDKRLRPRLPKSFSGTCALIQIVMPFVTFPISPEDLVAYATHNQRRKREIIPHGSFDSNIYLDIINVPRGVPEEYKARNQIVAGFESIFLWPTINKNVDWINYIYYNQQRFINYTRDAVRGIVEQLDRTSLMTWQNRLALDMLLAEKGGVCKMFGDMCCTFIPNNTSPDGSVTRALAGLTALSHEMAENAGNERSMVTVWLDKMLGKWKGVFLSCITAVMSCVAIVVCCGCCLLPCLRTLVARLITTALTKEGPGPLNMPLMTDGGIRDSDEEDETTWMGS